jgi:Uncharacterized conserved protein
MSNPSWSNVPNAWVLGIFGGFMYVTNYDAGTISQIQMSDGSIVNANWATGLTSPDGLVIDSTGTYMYVSNNANRISKINMSDGTINTLNWATGLSSPTGLVIDSTGTYMYVSNNANRISKINMSDGSIDTLNWATGLNGATGLVIDSTGTYMYVARYGPQTVSKINMSDGSINTLSWAIGLNGGPLYLAIDTTGTYMYVSQQNNGQISQILMSNGSIVNASYVSGLSTTGDLTINNNYIYVANYGNGNIGKYSLPEPPPCFKEGSKILTDTGYKAIETLRKGDLVKTLKHDFVPVVMIGKRVFYNPSQKDRIKDQLYKCSQDKYPELTEDLVITGCHSILVDSFTSNEQREKVIEVNGDTYVTDKKYRLPACVDEKASIYEVEGDVTIYHIALENEDYYMNYGVYANGLLVETCSKRYLKELSRMELIE